LTSYAFFECTTPSCRLRFPLDTQGHRGEFCPICGGHLTPVESEHNQISIGSDQAIPRRRIRVVLDNIRSSFNVGGIFRTADGVGIEHLYLCGITPTPLAHPDMVKTALGAEAAVPWSFHSNALLVAENLQEEGVILLALERTPQSIPIYDFSMKRFEDRPIALVIGHERAGVDPGLLAKCDAVIALPMVGGKASLNVAVAFGVAAYWLAYK
jgi:23S rRNA (guanosine2251-2'-O)-methyltransferase